MKIAMVHPHDIFSDMEPWTVRVTYLAKEFVKKGHQVQLIYFPVDSINLPEKSTLDGIEIIPLSRKANPLIFLRNIRDLREIFRDVDVVHFQKCFHFCAIPVVCASWLTKKPLHYDWDDWETKIYFLGGTPPSRLTGLFMHTVESLLPRVVDTISVASEALRKRALSLGFRDKRIFEAHVGGDLESFHPRVPNDTIRKKYNISGPIVLYLGQLHGGQYAHLFVRAAKIVCQQHPEPHVTFMLVGGGHNEGQIKNLIRETGVENNVLLTGLIPHHYVPEYVAAADLAVACFEDNDITKCKSPLKIVEYLAAGKAIVASDVGEVRNMLEGVGSIVPPGDEKSLADEILRLIVNPGLRLHMGQKARQRAEEKYNWTVTANNILNAYQLALFMNNKSA